jgi:hypothetical protein
MNSNNKQKLALYKVIASRLLIDDADLKEHEARKAEHREIAAGQGVLAKKLAARWVDAMVRTRKSLVRAAIAEAQTEDDLQRVVYFFMPTFMPTLAGYYHTKAYKLDWERIWMMDPARVNAGKTIKKTMMKAWLDPSHAMARKRLSREFESMTNNLPRHNSKRRK